MVFIDHVEAKRFSKSAPVQSAPVKVEKVAEESATEKPNKRKSKED